MSKENGFKETEIGLIPEDWDVVKLEEVSEKLKAGGTPRTNIKEYWNGDIPLVKVEDVASNEKYLTKTLVSITKEGLESSSAWIVPKDSILLSMYGTAGEVVINKIPVAVTQNILGIIKNYKITTGFLYYALIFSKNYSMSKITDKTIFKYFTLAKAKGLLFSLPSTPEQQKIASVLTKIQQAIEQQEQIITKTKELKRSLMQRLFTYGLRGVELKETEIGLMPESWEVVRFDDLADFKNGINFNIGQKGKKGILTIDVLNMYGERIDANLNNLYRVDIDLSNKSDYILRGNDILFVRSSLKREGVGWVSLFKKGIEPVTFCGFIIRARIKSDISLAEYLTYFFRSDVARKKLISSERVAITNINQGMLRSFLVPLPKIEEQQEIVDILTKVEDKLGQSQSRKKALQELFKSMLQLLMTGQVRVKDIDFGEDYE